MGSDGSHNQVPAGIIAPIKVGDRTVGTLKFYYKTPRAVDRTQYALASGFADRIELEHRELALEVQRTGNLSAVAIETIRADLENYKKEKLTVA